MASTVQSGNAQINAHNIEKDLAIEDYRSDRDYILISFKNALSNRNYEEAQSFVDRYGDAASFDDEFRTLAKLTSEKIEEKRKYDELNKKRNNIIESDK